MPEPLSRDEMLARMLAGDASADGLFVTGVVTTGIYCLPSCPARKPRPENVVFHADEATALRAGLRACKRCRPDRFYAGLDPVRERFDAALAHLRTHPSDVPDVSAFAAYAGTSTSTLHVLATRYANATPGALLHAARIDHAVELLQAGEATATEAAFAVGYASVSAFYDRFRARTGTTPGAVARASAVRR